MPRAISMLPRKSASQERSKLMVETLLDATTRVLKQEGYDRASTNRIATVAGVSIGSLYQYFPNKEALVAALVDRHIREMMNLLKTMLEESSSDDLETSMRRLIRAMIDAHRVDPALHRIFDEQIPRIGHLIEIEGVEREGFVLIRNYLERHRDELGVTNLDLATTICTTTVEALTHEIALKSQDPSDQETDEFVEEVTRMITGYLRPCPSAVGKMAPRFETGSDRRPDLP
jgi:AcrR family transcriptional regulator